MKAKLLWNHTSQNVFDGELTLKNRAYTERAVIIPQLKGTREDETGERKGLREGECVARMSERNRDRTRASARGKRCDCTSV